MKPRKCHCGKIFIPNSHNQIHCSRKCKYAKYNKTSKAKECVKRFRETKKYKEWEKSYNQLPERIKKKKEWMTSEEGKKYYRIYRAKLRETEEQKIKDKEYRKSPKRRDVVFKYKGSEKGKRTKVICEARRRVRKSKLVHDFTKEEWNKKLTSTKGVCPHCGKYVGINKLQLDHIIPVAKAPKGYIYTINDVQPLCKICNATKGDKV